MGQAVGVKHYCLMAMRMPEIWLWQLGQKPCLPYKSRGKAAFGWSEQLVHLS